MLRSSTPGGQLQYVWPYDMCGPATPVSNGTWPLTTGGYDLTTLVFPLISPRRSAPLAASFCEQHAVARMVIDRLVQLLPNCIPAANEQLHDSYDLRVIAARLVAMLVMKLQEGTLAFD